MKMDFGAEAIEKIGALVRAADGIRHPESEPRHVYYFRGGDGSWERKLADPAPRAHRADDLETFVAMMRGYGHEEALVLISESQVTGVLDPDVRREMIVWPLTPTRQWSILSGPQLSAPRNQRDFIRFLRVDLAGCVSPELIRLLRSLKFSNAGDAERNVGKSTEAIATSIRRACLTGDAELPDEATLRVTVYEEWAKETSRQDVTCALSVDLEDGELSLETIAGELHDAGLNVRREIQAALTAGLPGALIGLGAV
jgi:hypothetical protein